MFTIILIAILVPMVLYYSYRAFYYGPRKALAKDTTVLITGGVQGIGRLLSHHFVKEHRGTIKLIVIDVREDLATPYSKLYIS